MLARTSAKSTADRIYLPLIFETVEANPASLFATAVHPIGAVTAASCELKEVAVYLEIGLPGYSLFQLAEVAICEVCHGAAVRANEVMVVLRWPPHQIASAVAPCMHFADKPEFGQNVERTVNSDQPDIGVFCLNLLVYLSGGEMVMAEGDCIQDSAPLRRDFIAALPQYGCYLVLRECHRNT